MKPKLILSLFLSFAIGAAAIACSNGNDGEADSTEGELGGAREEAANIDTEIVGTWVDDSGEQLLVHTLELRADGTFHAKGGCRVADNGERRCYEVDEAKGRWHVEPATARAATPIVLKQTRGKEHRYFFTQGRIAGLGPNALVMRAKLGDTNKATFKRLADDVLAPGDVCVAGRSCAEGFECRSNCPPRAMCFVNIETCQPTARVQQGGVCGHDTNRQCADGLVCKDNCPEGARCFVSIFTCQPQ